MSKTIVIMAIGLIALTFLINWGMMALWNALIPRLFGGPVLTYWECYGLAVLVCAVGSMLKGASIKFRHGSGR